MNRAILVLLALATSARADLIAHVVTDKGSIDVIMQFDKAPQAVANFMTLSQGTRTSVDPTTGASRSAPYYVGEKFFRVLDSSNFKIAQTGSGTGTNSGGPGFTFKDEFDPSLTHVPYVLSMANSGPNTNGSQIFFTGSVPVNHLDDVHTIFGLIPDAASRAVIDAILAAGDNGSSVTAVSFDRTDPTAEAFDEFAQDLPTVSPTTATLAVTPGEDVSATLPEALSAGTLLSVYRSDTLQTWSSRDGSFVGYDTAPLSSVSIDNGSLTKAFYSLARIVHPASPTPSSLASRTLLINLPGGSDTVSFEFDESGTGGTYVYSRATEPGTIEYLDYTPSGYGATIIVDGSELLALRFVMSFDEEEEGKLIGRNNMSTWSGGWNSAGSGTHSLTK